METLVVDASVVVQACLEIDGFNPLAGRRLVGPHLVFSEALNALHEAAWRGEIGEELSRAARARLLDAPIERIQLEDHPSAAWDIADTLGWAKTYDAEYVALAQLLDCRLLTIDARLARGAGRAVRIVGPADL
jgi:predicted nucleic acid-binding protein